MKESINEEKKVESSAVNQLDEVDGANINDPIILPSLDNKDIETRKASLVQLQRNFGILPSSIQVHSKPRLTDKRLVEPALASFKK